MANGDYEIDELTWRSLSVERQLWLIFCEFNHQRRECHNEFCRLRQDVESKASQSDLTALATRFDRRKKIDTQFAGIMGFVGGIAGFIGSKLFGGFR